MACDLVLWFLLINIVACLRIRFGPHWLSNKITCVSQYFYAVLMNVGAKNKVTILELLKYVCIRSAIISQSDSC